jgi:hypothetical protein
MSLDITLAVETLKTPTMSNADAAALLVDLETGKVLIRNLNHATAVYCDARQGSVKTAELQIFLELFGATSKSAAGNRMCMQRSAQNGVNKYGVNNDDIAVHAIASTRGGRVTTSSLDASELDSLKALLAK